jgi:hypothetical protein
MSSIDPVRHHNNNNNVMGVTSQIAVNRLGAGRQQRRRSDRVWTPQQVVPDYMPTVQCGTHHIRGCGRGSRTPSLPPRTTARHTHHTPKAIHTTPHHPTQSTARNGTPLPDAAPQATRRQPDLLQSQYHALLQAARKHPTDSCLISMTHKYVIDTS